MILIRTTSVYCHKSGCLCEEWSPCSGTYDVAKLYCQQTDSNLSPENIVYLNSTVSNRYTYYMYIHGHIAMLGIGDSVHSGEHVRDNIKQLA